MNRPPAAASYVTMPQVCCFARLLERTGRNGDGFDEKELLKVTVEGLSGGALSQPAALPP